MTVTARKKQGSLCAAIAADSASLHPQQDIITAAERAAEYADVIEVRLDSLLNPEIEIFIKEIPKPLLFTNRPTWEGGAFEGDENVRISALLEAINQNAGYVDIEMKTSHALRQQVIDAASGTETQAIISWHNFQETPSASELKNIFLEQSESGSPIGKIVTLAKDSADVLRVLNLLELASEKSFPLIAFCMGQAGVISRVATVELGGFMTYAAADGHSTTAPGQLQVSTLHAILHAIADAK